MDTEQVEYEPEAFPGLVCRIKDPKLVFRLFSSGMIVITGGKIIGEIRRGLQILMEKLSIVDNKFPGAGNAGTRSLSSGPGKEGDETADPVRLQTEVTGMVFIKKLNLIG